MSLQAQSLIGLFAIPLIAWALSERRGAIAPSRLARILVAGIGLQILIAGVMLNIPAARAAFDWAASLVAALQAATNAGMRLVFGYLAGGPTPFDTVRPETSFILAFQALPLILVISALAKLLYHWGVLQKVVHAIGWVLQRSLGVTGPVGTSAAANVFVGMVEAPLLVRPYLATMSRGGLFATMTVGMAGVAGTVLALYATVLEPTLPGAAGHLIVASVISVPAALMLAELMVPDAAVAGQICRRHRHRLRRSAALQHGCHRPGHARGHRAAGQRHGHADRDRGAGGAGQSAAGLRDGPARRRAQLRADFGLGVCAAGLADRHPLGGMRASRLAAGRQDRAQRAHRLSAAGPDPARAACPSARG